MKQEKSQYWDYAKSKKKNKIKHEKLAKLHQRIQKIKIKIKIKIKTKMWQFLDENNIDYVAHDADPYVSADSDDIYAFVKAQGRFIATQRTDGVSTTGLLHFCVCCVCFVTCIVLWCNV